MDETCSPLRVLVVPELPSAALARFTKTFNVVFPASSKLQDIGDERPDVIICSIDDHHYDRQTFDALPRSLRALGTYSAGYDHIDLDAARAHGIAVFNTPGVLAASVAEVAMLLMLAAARRATESITLIRSGDWRGWTPSQLLGRELAGKRLGILGMGAIGREIAVRARAFGMEISYTSRQRAADDSAQFIEHPLDLVRQCDILVLSCPSNEQTRRFICRETLANAKPGLILVNIGRGDLVDDDALIEALTSGVIGAAGLDVFNGEPSMESRYLSLPNVFMTPHIGSSTVEARVRMADALVEAICAWQAGSRPRNQLA